MKTGVALLLALLTATASLFAAQTVEGWQQAAVQKYPALAQSGSPLNQRLLALIAEKRKTEPAFFAKPDWPLRAANAAATALQAEETATSEKAKADEAARLAKMTPEEQEWDRDKARWVFERLVFGDKEEAIASKLNRSKLVTLRVAPSSRVPLGSRFQWVFGETKFHIDFEMKGDSLAAIVFENSPEKTSNLDGFIHDDWGKLRAAAIEQFGPPTKTVEFPATSKQLLHGILTLTDAWERPGCRIRLGLIEDEGRASVALRISDPAHAPE